MESSKMSAGRPGERGVALLAALTVMALLVALVLPFNQSARVDVALAANVRDELKALYIAQSGLTLALASLRADTTPEADGQGDQWAGFQAFAAGSASLFEEGGFDGRILDQNAKVNINEVLDDKGKIIEARAAQLQRLFGLLGLDQAKLDAVLDWLDADNDTRPFGAESDWYQAGGLESPANGPLESIADLLKIKGITLEDFQGGEGRPGLKDVLTINSDGPVNINTAGAVVIASLCDGIDVKTSAAIVAARQGKTYEKLEDIAADVPGIGTDVIAKIEPLVTLKSSSYLVEITATCNEARQGLRAEVRRVGEVVGVTRVRIL
ncbi:MAG: type II secretion system minor pseudopilin GspK [Pseudomonadota bacterium]